jgi:hypothetical protein
MAGVMGFIPLKWRLLKIQKFAFDLLTRRTDADVDRSLLPFAVLKGKLRPKC